jgi:hypothetical protein
MENYLCGLAKRTSCFSYSISNTALCRRAQIRTKTTTERRYMSMIERAKENDPSWREENGLLRRRL